MMKMSSMGQDMRASVLVIVLIAGHHLQNLNNCYYLVAGAICVRRVIGKKLEEQDVLKMLECVTEL